MRGARAISGFSVTTRAAVRLLCCRRRPQFFWVSRQPPDTRRVGCEPPGAVFLTHFPSSCDGSDRRSMRLSDNLVGCHRTGHASPEHRCGLGSAFLYPLFYCAASLDMVALAARWQAGVVGDMVRLPEQEIHSDHYHPTHDRSRAAPNLLTSRNLRRTYLTTDKVKSPHGWLSVRDSPTHEPPYFCLLLLTELRTACAGENFCR